MRKRMLAYILVMVMMISDVLHADAMSLKKTNEQENEIQTVMTEKPISELEAGESTVSVLESIVTCLGEEKDLPSEGEETLIVDKYSDEGLNYNVQAEFSQESARIGKIIDEQMRNYLNNSGGIQAEVADNTDATSLVEGVLSKVKFSLSSYDFYIDDNLMLWVMDAISLYPSLSTLHTHISYSYVTNSNGKKLSSLTIACAVKEKDIKTRTAEYEKELAKLIKIPLSDDMMSDAEKILYVHDRLVNIGHYVNGDGIMLHTPTSILLDSQGVCQSYANIMNQALYKLGIESLFVCSDTHAWNAVRLDNKWYYVDATWADPVLSGTKRIRSYVSHEYILVQADDFNRDHVLDSNYTKIYGSITNNFGYAYDSFLPMDDITGGMWYSNGLWYFGYENDMYCWNQKNNDLQKATNVGKNGALNVGEVGGNIYYANYNGLFRYENGISVQLIFNEISDMYVVRNVICYDVGSNTYEYVVEEPEPSPIPVPTQEPMPSEQPTDSPAPTMQPGITMPPMPTIPPISTEQPEETQKPEKTQSPEVTIKPEPTQEPIPSEQPISTKEPEATQKPTATISPNNTLKPAITMPAMPTIKPVDKNETDTSLEMPKVKIKKVTNKKGKKSVVKFKKLNGAVKYQVMYHTKKSFVRAKSVYTKKSSATIKKLKLKKTYYIKVRAYFRSNGKLVPGKWSSVKKIKIKK